MTIKVPKKLRIFFVTVSNMFAFAGRYFSELIKPPYEFNETLRQFFYIGYKSLPLVSITGFIIGLTLALQLKPTLSKFGAESLIPQMLAIAIVREIGPVIIALICAGKMGSGIGAELGSMKVTEQIDAMEVSALNPFKFLVVTRITATMIMVPLLIIYSDALSMVGGYLAMTLSTDVSLKLFFQTVFNTLSFNDIIPATIKTFAFGFAIGAIGSYQGFNSNRGTESVGKAANSAVVLSSLMVILIDMIAVQITALFS
ncbi:ABC transporter permease [soil metagenome]